MLGSRCARANATAISVVFSIFELLDHHVPKLLDVQRVARGAPTSPYRKRTWLESRSERARKGCCGSDFSSKTLVARRSLWKAWPVRPILNRHPRKDRTPSSGRSNRFLLYRKRPAMEFAGFALVPFLETLVREILSSVAVYAELRHTCKCVYLRRSTGKASGTRVDPSRASGSSRL